MAKVSQFAKRLKKAREAAGYPSAQQFALAVGLTPHQCRAYERGEREPDFEKLILICRTLRVEPSTLLPLEQPKKKHLVDCAA